MRAVRLPLVAAVVALLAACGGGEDDAAGGGGPTNGGTGTVGGSGLPLYVLLGGTTKPAGADIHLDSRLDPGELFIIPKDPLLPSEEYEVAVTAAAGADTFTRTWRFTTGATNAITSQGTPLGEMNALRVQSSASIPAFTTHPGYVTAAVKHAGYLSEVQQAAPGSPLTHGESNSPARRFFVDNDFGNRINVGCVGAGDSGWGTDNAVAITLIGEDIASNGGPAAIANLWNTVYHRLPMMRSQYRRVGLGDRVDAAADPTLNAAPQVITTPTTAAFLTIDFGGRGDHAQLPGHWPTDGQTNVYFSFRSDSEGPDPIDAGNANGTPTDEFVGVPIHVIVPTSNDFTSFTITVTLVP